ncbi:MAG: HAMP domain-containing histidine kinase [Spirochaetales bacterium]|nr:HAMP domain-containing histidine kinase [Spirochaetales bacterium]
MSDFFTKIKVRLFVQFSLLFAGLQGMVLIVVAFLHIFMKVGQPWEPVIVYFILEVIVFLLFLLLLRHILNNLLGGQEAVSRILFRNTRNIINNISHEWRTPLNAIMGFTEELYNSEEDSDKKEALKAISQNSRRLFVMSKKLIDFSSIETGLYKIDPQFHSVDLLLQNLLNKYNENALSKGLKIELVNNIPAETRIYFDFHAVFEILSMIVENAVKFTFEGSISLYVEYKRKILRFAVTDSGIGIPANIKRIVLELYRQGNSELDREFEGIGMGLTIASKLVELLKGNIRISDNTPRGTVVTVELKCESREKKFPAADEILSSAGNRLSGEQKKILRQAAVELTDMVKVFNPGKIKEIGLKLKESDSRLEKYAERLLETARTYDEAGLATIVEQMLEDCGS